METALAGVDRSEVATLLANLAAIKDNLRQAIQKKQTSPEARYG